MSTEDNINNIDSIVTENIDTDIVIPGDLPVLKSYLLEQTDNKGETKPFALNSYLQSTQREILPLRLEFSSLLKQLSHLDRADVSNEKKFLELRKTLMLITNRINVLSMRFQKIQPLLRVLKENHKELGESNLLHILESLDAMPYPEVPVPLPKQFQPKATNSITTSSNIRNIKSPMTNANSPMTPGSSLAAQNTAKSHLMTNSHTQNSNSNNYKGKMVSTSGSTGSVKKPTPGIKRGNTPKSSLSPMVMNTPVISSNSVTSVGNVSGGKLKNYSSNNIVSGFPQKPDNSITDKTNGINASMENIVPGNILQGISVPPSSSIKSSNMTQVPSSINKPQVSNSNNSNPNINADNNTNNGTTNAFSYGNINMNPSSILQNINSNTMNGNSNNTLSNNGSNEGMIDMNSLDLYNLDDFLK